MTFPLSSLSNQLMTDADKELRAQVVLLTESEKERFSGRKMALLECIIFHWTHSALICLVFLWDLLYFIVSYKVIVFFFLTG